jgi:hypothetical protein
MNYKIIVSPIAFFIVDEPSKTVFLNAVFHTSQNPDKYPDNK